MANAHFSRELTKVASMQNTRINLDIDKTISLVVPFGGAVRCFAASALKSADYHIRITPPHFT